MGSVCGCGPSVVPDPPTEQEILDDLERSEGKIWRIAFMKIDCDSTGTVATHAELLRPYIMEASALHEDTVEAVLQRTGKDGKLPFDSFANLLRDHASDETESLATFQQLAGGEDLIESIDARNALRLYGERKCGARGAHALDEDIWEKVLNEVMKDVEVTVDMELWVRQCSLLARYIRVFRQQRAPIL
uniref:EF-hand domain-containing protein n=1 Tax=Alexandrium andersonii TaxID=327968 RepID=A0A7S2N1T8_9DINO|mmetsp:Transcript_81553/g.182332  ORF Transcript_81553/g.182332 Transcript_81553/m.182332 type:complete len:189 (+) Transcript_81553:64-630(+)